MGVYSETKYRFLENKSMQVVFVDLGTVRLFF